LLVRSRRDATMQRLTYILFHLDEALRYIDDGRIERLRLALLLLDNAAELQLDGRVRDHMAIEEINERTREQTVLITELMPESRAELPGLLTEIVAWEPLTKAQKRALDRFFDEKLRFLSERYTTLDPSLAKIISYLHRYRNEAYHEARVRVETVRTAALIYFEANCALLLTVFSVHSYASNEDYSWLEERFGIRSTGLFIGGGLQHVVDRLRKPVLPNLETVVDTLKSHLDDRIEGLLADLDFIVDGSRPENRDEAARIAQLFAGLERGDIRGSTSPDDYVGRWTLGEVEDTKQAIGSLSDAVDRLDAFSRFAEIEQRIEAFEQDIRPLVVIVDQMVDEEIDRRRGK
jgi:hypothetical protein